MHIISLSSAAGWLWFLQHSLCAPVYGTWRASVQLEWSIFCIGVEERHSLCRSLGYAPESGVLWAGGGLCWSSEDSSPGTEETHSGLMSRGHYSYLHVETKTHLFISNPWFKGKIKVRI